VTVFTQAPDGALQDVEVFAQSARRGYPVFVGREGWMRMPYGYESRGANMTPEQFSYDVEED